jgi:hypothetical protein
MWQEDFLGGEESQEDSDCTERKGFWSAEQNHGFFAGVAEERSRFRRGFSAANHANGHRQNLHEQAIKQISIPEL